MNSFTFSYPTKVYFGEGALAQAPPASWQRPARR